MYGYTGTAVLCNDYSDDLNYSNYFALFDTCTRQVNIWERAKRRRYQVHTLTGGHGASGGYDGLNYMLILHGDAGPLGTYPILSKLPDKFSRFLYEFHDFRFERLELPPLPDDRSDFDVHGALSPEQVTGNR